MTPFGLALMALAIAVYASVAVRLERWSITMPMVFVGLGFLLGPGVTGMLPLEPHADGVKELTEITLALLLFADASTLNFGQVRLDARLPLRLLVVGLPLTMVLGTLTAVVVLPGEDLAFAALLGAMLAPTDAALGLPVFNNPKVPVRIRRALNVESGLNDGIATPFVTLALAFAIATEEQQASESWLWMALSELGLGVLVGGAIGVLGGRLLVAARQRGWTTDGPARLAVLGLALAAYAGALAVGGNGFIAAFVGGIAFSAATRGAISEPAEFTEQCGTFLSVLVWIVFGAVMVAKALQLTTDWRPIAYAVLSLTLVRMIPVALALTGTRFRPDTTALMGWFGPRGLASVVFTLLAVIELEDAGRLDATLFTVATWTILLSVMAHGLSAGPLASWYARRLAAADKPHGELDELPELYERRSILRG